MEVEGSGSSRAAIFKVFQQYYQNVPSLMIVFLTSHLKGDAQDWWVHCQDDFWYILPKLEFGAEDAEIMDYNVGPRYQFPEWDMFVEEFCEQFRDPAIELVHEKRMGELRMGSDPAHLYFWKLEREAKLVNQLADKTDRGTLIWAVRKGIPSHYANMIANISFGIPHTYSEWKHHILQMYNE